MATYTKLTASDFGEEEQVGKIEVEVEKPKYKRISAGDFGAPEDIETEEIIKPETPELDRVSQLLASDRTALAKYEEGKRSYEEQVGYDEFSPVEEERLREEGVEKPTDVSLTELAESPRFIRLASNYLTKRVGKEAGDVNNYESKEDFVERYMEHTRALSMNMGSVAKELSIINKMSDEEKKDVAKLYQLTPHIATAGTKGGDTIMNSLTNHLYYGITDPSNVITLGSGYLVKQLAGKTVSNKLLLDAVKSQWAPIVGTAGVDGVLGYMENSDRQSIDMEVGLRENRDLSESVAAGGLSALFGAGFTALGVGWAAKSKSPSEKLNERLGITGKDAATTDPKKTLEEKKADIEEFDPIRGIVARDKLDESNRIVGDTKVQDPAFVDPQMRWSVTDDITMVVGEWAQRNPEVLKEVRDAYDKETKISDIMLTLISRERDDADTLFLDLEDALAAAGVERGDFAQALRGSVSDAAKTMNSYSQLAKRLKKMETNDPEVASLVKAITGAEDVAGPFSKFWGLLRKADAETRAIMVSGIGTTVRNAFGGAAYISMNSFDRMVETTLYHGGKAVSAITEGSVSKEGVKTGLADMWRDSTQLIVRLAKQGESDEIATRLLKDNSELHNRLFHTIQGVGEKVNDRELSALAKSMNTLNRVQDGVFRRAIFTQRVDYYLRRSELGSVDDFLRANKPIPSAILKKATDDSLYGTFAYMPKNKGMGLDQSMKANVESMGNHVIRIVENLPFVPVVGTGDHPFVRFMFNAMSFQYKYSPFQFGTAATDAIGMAYKKGVKKEDINPAEWAKMRDKVSTAAVGSAAFMAALRYRDENPELQWFEMEDESGRPVDVRSMFPAAPYLAMAEFYLATTKKGHRPMDFTSAVEGFTGAQMKTGGLYGMELITEVAKNTALTEDGYSTINEEKLADMLGGYFGLQAARVLTPAQFISDIVAATDDEEKIVRDKNQIEGVGWERFADAAKKTVMYKTPMLQQELPPLASPTREGNIMRQDTSVRQFYGARTEEARTPIEDELVKRGIKLYTLAPRTQDGRARNAFAKLTPIYLEAIVGGTLQSEFFKKLPPAQQQVQLEKRISEVKRVVTEIAAAQSTANSYTEGGAEDFVARGMWMALSGARRKMVNEYLKDSGQPPVEESRDFLIGLELARNLYKAL